ncbi:MAG: hypothetical protein HY829_12260 [Actinobacteria bacterium]|nr:hypothetical protein [Actinomycetota bacterium]
MTDPIKQWLDDRVTAATPPSIPSFEGIRGTARTRRRAVLTVAASIVAAAGVAVGAWVLVPAGHAPGPSAPTISVTTSPTTARPDPSFDPTEPFPSGLVARLPDRDIALPADTSCWRAQEDCRRGLLLYSSGGPDLGEQDGLIFWFARPGWTFAATFYAAGQTCPRATTVEAVRTGPQWFRLSPADQAGTYEVDLVGSGPEGSTSTRFTWTTTADGPVDPPTGNLGVSPTSLGQGSYSLELMLADLPFQPTTGDLSPVAEVGLTPPARREHRVSVPLVTESLACGQRGYRGSFYYQLLDEPLGSGQQRLVLSSTPVDVRVAFDLRGTTYVGTGRWNGDGIAPLSFAPPLPGSGGSG